MISVGGRQDTIFDLRHATVGKIEVIQNISKGVAHLLLSFQRSLVLEDSSISHASIPMVFRTVNLGIVRYVKFVLSDDITQHLAVRIDEPEIVKCIIYGFVPKVR